MEEIVNQAIKEKAFWYFVQSEFRKEYSKVALGFHSKFNFYSWFSSYSRLMVDKYIREVLGKSFFMNPSEYVCRMKLNDSKESMDLRKMAYTKEHALLSAKYSYISHICSKTTIPSPKLMPHYKLVVYDEIRMKEYLPKVKGRVLKSNKNER